MKASDLRKGGEYWVVYNGIVWDAVCIQKKDERTAQFKLTKDNTSFVAVIEYPDVYEDPQRLITRCEFEANSWDKQRERIEEFIRNGEDDERADLERQHEDASDNFHAETAMDMEQS